jgi:hypothetical protein
MTGEVKNSQQVNMNLTLEEWSAVHAAVQEAWSKAVKLDDKARKADFNVKEQTTAAAKALGNLLDKISVVVAR